MACARLAQAGGLVFALALQALFALLLLWSMTPRAHPKLAHEMTLWLPQAFRTISPSVIDARERSRASVSAAPLADTPPISPPLEQPPIDLHGLGQSLRGCAPEDHCPSGGTEIARPPRDADLSQPPDEHVKDRAGWREQWAEDHFTFGPCARSNSIAVGTPPDHSAAPVMDCQLQQHIAETRRAEAAHQAIFDAKAAPPHPRP